MFGALVHVHCFTSTGFYKTARSIGLTPEDASFNSFVTGLGTAGNFSKFAPFFLWDNSIRTALIPEVLEFDFELSSFTGMSIDLSLGLKYTFVDTRNFAMAFYMNLTGTSNTLFIKEFSAVSIQPALLATWSFSDSFSITVAPRACFLCGPAYFGEEASTPEAWRKIESTLVGATFVFDIGKEFGVMPEVGVFYSPSGNIFIWHGGVGLRFDSLASLN